MKPRSAAIVAFAMVLVALMNPMVIPSTTPGSHHVEAPKAPQNAPLTNYPTLADFWSGNSYFERSQYETNSQLQQGYGYDEPAPIARPDIGPNVIYLYYHTHINVPDGAIGLAISYDGGASFTPYNGGQAVVPDGTNNCDPDSGYVVMPSVLFHNGLFYMVYEAATKLAASPGQGYPWCGNVGEVFYATSPDGIVWTKQGMILQNDPNNFECNNIGGTFIGWFNNQFYVFYHGNCGTPLTASSRSKIGMAYGTDLHSLTKYPGNPVMDVGVGSASWDSRVNGRPTVVQEGSYYYMAFEGSDWAYCSGAPNNNAGWGWGLARSADLMHWEKYAYNPIRQTFQDVNCLNNNPYLFLFNGAVWVYQFDKGVKNVLLFGTDPYLRVYLSVNGGQGQCERFNNLGFVDGDGWAQGTSLRRTGYLCYGPYDSSLPAGKYSVTFQDMIDSLSGPTPPDKILTEDINDASNNPNGVVSTHDIYRNDFGYAYVYQTFEQMFQSTAQHQYEWRTWWYDNAYTRQHMVFVRQLDGKVDTTPPTSSIGSLPSNSPTPFTVSWSGSDSQSGLWSFDLQYQDNGGQWTNWWKDTPGAACCVGTLQTSAQSPGQCFHTYGFQVRARDNAGNVAGYSPAVSTYIPCSTTLSNNPASSDWTGQSGTWTLVNGYMDGSGTSAQIQSSATFSSDRTVSVRTITITSGGAQWKTAYLYGKYVDFYDKLFMFIGTDGSVDIAMWQGSVTHTYGVSGTGLSPYVWHTFTMVMSGNTANAYVDGNLVVTATDPIIGALGAAPVGLASWGPSESQFDSVTIS